MCPYSPESYDKINNYLLNLFINLNTSIKLINGIIDELLMVDKFNKNADFLKFVFQFRQGFFLSAKCEGCLEFMVITKYFTSTTLHYFINDAELVHKNLTNAISYIDNIETAAFATNNEDFKKLMTEIKSMCIIVNTLPTVLNLYNLSC